MVRNRIVPAPSGAKKTVALIGVAGFNVQRAVLSEFDAVADRVSVVGFDLHDPPRRPAGGSFVRVRDNHELADRLATLKPDAAVIETPCSEHPPQLELAVAAGIPLVVTDKMLAEDVPAAEAAAARLDRRPGVFLYDHYLHFQALMLVLAAGWLGRIRGIRAELFETGAIGREQERSHRTGVANFLHHAAALPVVCGMPPLAPTRAAFARHPAATVPDTFRSLRAADASGRFTLSAAVGKYMPAARKMIRLAGDRGRAVIDRTRNRLRVTTSAGQTFVVRLTNPDSGYGPLARAVAAGRMPPHALTPAQAVEVMRLMDAAHRTAVQLPAYPGDEVAAIGPAGRPAEYVTDWCVSDHIPACPTNHEEARRD